MKIISIAGGSGSGKTTIAKFLHQKHKRNSVIISLDDYYFNKEQQIKKNGFCNFDHPKAIDCELLLQNISELKEKGSTSVPRYSFKDRARLGFIEVHSKELLIVEGLHSIELLESVCDVAVFIRADLDLSLLRRINRDINDRGRSIESITEQYIKDVRPSYLKYIKNQEKISNIVLDNNKSKSHLVMLLDKYIGL